MGEAKRRKDQGLPPKKKKYSGFGEQKNSIQSQSKRIDNQD